MRLGKRSENSYKKFLTLGVRHLISAGLLSRKK